MFNDMGVATYNINNVGGAIEITLTRADTSGSDGAKDRLQHSMGYVALFGNTICMVSYRIL